MTFCSVVIPAYNEAKLIASCIQRCTSFIDEIVVVADGTDHTADIAEKYGALTVTSPHRLGKGGAFKQGVQATSGECILLLDADFPVLPEDVISIMSFLSQYDIVIGSRYVEGASVNGQSYHRKMLSLGFRTLCNSLFHLQISDFQCGVKAFQRHVILSLLRNLSTVGFAFDVELLVKAHQYGYTLHEYPVTWNTYTYSKVGWKHVFEMGKDVLQLYGKIH